MTYSTSPSSSSPMSVFDSLLRKGTWSEMLDVSRGKVTGPQKVSVLRTTRSEGYLLKFSSINK